ncbi:hypothetical protein PPACK8108_LOCUS5340, partial [Phakopsora pachyrhizi]
LNPGGPFVGGPGGVGPKIGGHLVDQGTAGVPKEMSREKEVSLTGGDGGPSSSPAPKSNPPNHERGWNSGEGAGDRPVDCTGGDGGGSAWAAPKLAEEACGDRALSQEGPEEMKGSVGGEGASTTGDSDLERRRPGPAVLSAPPLEAPGCGQSLAQARISSRHWAWTKGLGSLGFGGFGRRDSWWALRDLTPASPGSSWLERPASEVRPSAEDGRGEEKGGKEGKGERLTYASLFETAAPIAGAVPAGVCIFALRAGKEAGKAAVPDHRWLLVGKSWLVCARWPVAALMDKEGGRERWKMREGGEEGEGEEGQANEAAAEDTEKLDRVFGGRPGRVIPVGGQNMTPGEILPGVQKSCQIFDSCLGSGTMQGVLDWIRAGLFEDRGIRGMGMDGAEEWHGRAGGGCGGRNGKGGQRNGGAGRGFCWILQDFEEEGGQKLGGGAHQGQSGWSKTTGATDFFKEAPDLEKEPEIHSESNEEKTEEVCVSMSASGYDCTVDGLVVSQEAQTDRLDYDFSRWEPEETSKKITKSDIGPAPSPHFLIDQDFSPITTHSQDWMDVNNGFFEVRQYAKPCAFCTRNNLVCCEATRSGSKKCEACQVVKGVCVFSKTPVFSEGRKSYGFEHPIHEVPTDNFDSGIRSVLKKAGIPTGGIPILSKGWVNHEGVESNQLGSSECSARSQLERAQEAKATQHTKRQKANPVTLTEATWATLNTVAIGSSSKEDGDDEGDDEDGGINRCGKTAETEDNKYCPPIEAPNPPQGKSTIPTAGKYPAHQSTSLLQEPLVRSKALEWRQQESIDDYYVGQEITISLALLTLN